MTRQRRRMGGPVRHWGAVGLLAWCIGCQSDSGDEGANTESPDAQMENGTGASTNGDGDSNGMGSTSAGTGSTSAGTGSTSAGTGSTSAGTGSTSAGATSGDGDAPAAGAPGDGDAGPEGSGGAPLPPLDPSVCEGVANGSHCQSELTGEASTRLLLCAGDQVLADQACPFGCNESSGSCKDKSGGGVIGGSGSNSVGSASEQCRTCATGKVTTFGFSRCESSYDSCMEDATCESAVECLQSCGTQSCRDTCIPGPEISELLELESCWWEHCTTFCPKNVLILTEPKHPIKCEACLEATCTGLDACLNDPDCGATFECAKLCETDGCRAGCQIAYLPPASQSLWAAMDDCADACSGPGEECWYPPRARGSGGGGGIIPGTGGNTLL